MNNANSYGLYDGFKQRPYIVISLEKASSENWGQWYQRMIEALGISRWPSSRNMQFCITPEAERDLSQILRDHYSAIEFELPQKETFRNWRADF